MILILFFLTMAIGLLAQWHVKRTYARHSRTPTVGGYTGAEAAHAILRQAGITNVTIVEHDELLGDHYDPKRKRMVLSSANYHGTSAAALGVAAHECGHAIQHKLAYAPLEMRMAAVSVTSFASQLVMWIPLLGMFTGLIAPRVGLLIMAVCWGHPDAVQSRHAARGIRRLAPRQSDPCADGLHSGWRGTGRSQSGIKRGRMDVRGRVHFLIDLFPVVLAPAADWRTTT